MLKTFVLAAMMTMVAACAAFQKPSSAHRLSEGGKAYCEAHRAKDEARMAHIVGTHKLDRGPWDGFCTAMEKGNYEVAFTLAESKKLGAWAKRESGIPMVMKRIEDGWIFNAYLSSKKIGLDEQELKAFAETAYDLLASKGECVASLEVARYFELSDRHFKGAVRCIERQYGQTAALTHACANRAPFEVIEPYRQSFLQDLPRRYGQKSQVSGFMDAVMRCEWDMGALERLYGFLVHAGNLEVAVHVLEELTAHWPQDRQYEEARKLFDLAHAASDAKMASLIRKSFKEAIGPDRVMHLLDLLLLEMQCPEALAFTYKERLPDAAIERVFTSPSCIGSEFDRFRWALPAYVPDVWRKYFDFAIKHKRFALARSLVDEAKFGKKGATTGDPYCLIVDTALANHAYVTLLRIDPPPGEPLEDYRERIFDHALSHGEEWTAATYAKEFHRNPEAIVERAYLHSMERGEYVQAVQIAERYGDPSKLAERARLAFEMTMLAELPQDAQYILRLGKVEDPERHQRAARMRFRQNQAAERKALREKKRFERKKREASGEWSVTRDE